MGMSKASLWDERSNKFTQTTRSVQRIISKMSGERHAHYLDFTVNIPRSKFDDGASIIILRPAVVIVDDVRIVQYTGTLKMYHDHWHSKERPTMRAQICNTLDPRKRVHRTALDIQIQETEEKKVVLEDLTETQIKIEVESTEEEYSSEDSDRNMNEDYMVRDSGADVQHLQMPVLEDIRIGPSSPIYSDNESHESSRESKQSHQA